MRALRKGWIKREQEPEKPAAYLLWEDDGARLVVKCCCLLAVCAIARSWRACLPVQLLCCVRLGWLLFDVACRSNEAQPPHVPATRSLALPANIWPACRPDSGQDSHRPHLHPRPQAQAAGSRGELQPAGRISAHRGEPVVLNQTTAARMALSSHPGCLSCAHQQLERPHPASCC